MGREIVYCWKCAKRVEGADFDTLKAYRYGDKVSCDECVYDLVGDLPAEEQEAILSGNAGKKPERPPSDTKRRGTGPIPKSGGTTRTTTVRTGQTGRVPTTRGTGRLPLADGAKPRKGMTRSIPKADMPVAEDGADGSASGAAAKKKKLILIGAGGGGLLLVVVVALLILLSARKPARVAPPAEEAVAEKGEPKPDPKLAREAAAKKAYDAAMAVFKDKPGELGPQLKALQDAELAAAGTSLEEDVKKQLEVLHLEVEKQLKTLDGELAPLLPERKFKELLALLSGALDKHDVPEWKKGVETKRKQIDGIIEDNWLRHKKAALEAKEAGDAAKVDEAVAKIAAWEIPELLARLKKELGTVEAPPDSAAAPDASKTPAAKKPAREAKPLSKEMGAYQAVWERAAGMAFQRDFDGAMAEIRRSAREIDADEVRKESATDLELLERLKSWVEETVKLQASQKRLQDVALEFHDRPGQLKAVEGKVTKIFDQRFELRVAGEKDGKKTTSHVLVEFADLSGRSLGEQAKKLRTPPGKEDGRMAALLCLLEGDEEAARALGGRDAEALPDRYWLHAPSAKEKSPKSNAKEFEARDLYHKAEAEYKDMQTRGGSLQKFKTLLNEFPTARVVRLNQAAIVKRADVPKEFVFNVRNLKTEGVFRPTRKTDLVLQATKDVDVQDMRDNFVEAEFYAQAGPTYRCWALVGACCKETFAFYLQTSERTTTHQGKQLPIDPGANMAEAVKIQVSGLKNDHAAHAPKDKKLPHPKDATRWDWIPIPLPRAYAEAGPKSVRLLTDQAGFAVKFMVVSSLRTKTPDDKETAEMVKALSEEPESDDTGVKGSPQPKDWLLAGPFNEPLNAVQAPERDIDLAKEMTGKGNKKFKWKLVTNEPKDGYSVFNWEDGKTFNPKDNVSGYALIHVKARIPMTVKLSLGHDDGGRVWVNGEMVHTNDKSNLKNDAYQATAVLEEGWNRVLIKVRNGNGGFGLSFRILDESGAPVEGLAYSAYGDELIPP